MIARFVENCQQILRKEEAVNKHEFRAEVKKELYLRNMKYADLAFYTGYSPGTIRIMMNDDSRLSPKAMDTIANVLSIDMKGDDAH